MKKSNSFTSTLISLSGLLIIGTACQSVSSPESDQALLAVDFRDSREVDPTNRSWSYMPDQLPGTGIRPTPHREVQGVRKALVRSLQEEPLWPEGSLQITRNETEQGIHRTFPESVPFNPDEEILLLRTTTFADATTGGTNSIAVRLWVQSGLGPNEHRERVELSTHFNHHERGSRQVYPNAYYVRDGWETWAMPEGTNSRRAGVYYLLGAEPRNDEIRGSEAVEKGFYWTWDGLHWPSGWEAPLGGALYEPPDDEDDSFQGTGLYTTTAIYRQTEQRLSKDPHSFATSVDIRAPRSEGRVMLESPLPREIDEVRLILRSQTPPEGRDWTLPKQPLLEEPLLGVVKAEALVLPRADINLDGKVDFKDWSVLLKNQSRQDALHHHGDLTGNQQVDLRDAFFLAARLPIKGPPQSQAALEDWQAWTNDRNEVYLQVPAGGKVYGWMVKSEGNDLSRFSVTGLFGDKSFSYGDEQQVGEVNLTTPFRNTGTQTKAVKLGQLQKENEWSGKMKVQTNLGTPATTLPLRKKSQGN